MEGAGASRQPRHALQRGGGGAEAAHAGRQSARVPSRRPAAGNYLQVSHIMCSRYKCNQARKRIK